MTLSLYAARANVSYLQQHHPDWSHAQLAAALGYSKAWVKKWLKRLREEQAAGISLEQTLQGHSRTRKHLPSKTHPLVVEQILAIRDQPPEGLRRVPGQGAIRSYLQRDPALALFQLPVPSCKTIYRVLKRHQRIPERDKPVHQPLERPQPMSDWQLDAERCLQCAC
jgi:biotin operon repressor